MSKISALVSAYKAEEFLSVRIQNLFGQAKDVDLEIIVVCLAGSPEDRIASNYNVKVIRTPIMPPLGEAWNLAIEQAAGDYLTTANCDDRYYIGGLKRMVEELDDRPEIGLVFSQVDRDQNGYVTPWKRIDNDTGEIPDPYGLLKQRCIIGPMPLWRRSLGIRFNEHLIVAADYEAWLRMAKNGVRMFYIQDSCGVYMVRENSLEHQNKQLCGIETQRVRELVG